MKKTYSTIIFKLSIVPLVIGAFLGAMIVQGGVRQEILYKKKIVRHANGELLVKYKKKTGYAQKMQSICSAGSAKLHEFGSTGYVHVRIAPGTSLERSIDRYAADPNVESVQPNYIYTALSVPDDPGYSAQWGLHNSAQTVSPASYVRKDGSAINNPGIDGSDMKMEPAWDIADAGSDVVVAVLDTGVNYNHEDLADVMWDGGSSFPNHGYNFSGEPGNDPMDYNGHGTILAGIIGAQNNNGKGGTGICHNTKIMAVRVLDAAGNGTSASVIHGITFAAAHGAQIINMSMATNSYDQAVYDAISSARSSGILIVAAAGNGAQNIDTADAPENNAYPCEYDLDNVICVTALDQKYSLALFSNYGNTKVDIAAPGVNVYNTWAGTTITNFENFSTGWLGSDANHPGTTDWGTTYTNDIDFPDIRHDFLVIPTYQETYRANSSDKAYKDFAPFAQNADGVVLNFTAQYSLYDINDSLGLYVNNTQWEPVIAESTKIAEICGGTGKTGFSIDVTRHVKGKNNVQFVYLLNTDDSGSSTGVLVGDMNMTALWLNATTYTNYTGSSVSAAAVSGLAAMLMSFNGDYTYADVISAVCSGGRTVPALQGKTVTGKAADALGALEYVSAPDGIGAEVQ